MIDFISDSHPISEALRKPLPSNDEVELERNLFIAGLFEKQEPTHNLLNEMQQLKDERSVLEGLQIFVLTVCIILPIALVLYGLVSMIQCH